MQQIISYHRKKGEDIPLDSEHYLYELANQKKLDESEVLKMFSGGVVTMFFGTLALESEKLRLKVKWNPARLAVFFLVLLCENLTKASLM